MEQHIITTVVDITNSPPSVYHTALYPILYYTDVAMNDVIFTYYEYRYSTLLNPTTVLSLLLSIG